MAPSLTYGSQNSSRLQSRREEETQRSRIFPRFHLPPIGLERIRARTRIIGNSSPKPSSSPDSSDWEHRPLQEKSSNMAKTRNSSTSASTPKKPKTNIATTAAKRSASRNSKDKRPSKTRKTAADDTSSSASTKKMVIKEEEEQDDEVITNTWLRPVSISSEDDGSEQLAAARQKIKALKQELESLKQQHKTELTQLKAELETARTQTSTSQTACEGEKETARTLREQLEATESNLADARESITKLEETNDLLEKENEKLKAQVTTLNTELSSEQEKNKSLLPRQSDQQQNPSSKPTLNTTTTTTKMDSQRSYFPNPLSPSPAITISSTCSDGLGGDAETEKRMKTLQRNYMSLKTDYDILSYWAAQISDNWKSIDHSVFGTFGHSVKELRGILEKAENNKKKVRGEGAV